MTIEEILAHDEQFRYMMLDRMRTDCEYYLIAKHSKHLWAKNEYKQIAYMKAIWNSFAEDGKPEWLSMERIEEYEREMTPWLGDTPLEELADIKPFYVGELFFRDGWKERKPDQLWFGCQIAGKTMGGDAFIHYDNALRPVYINHGNYSERYENRTLRNVTCDCEDGYLFNFRR